MQNFVIMAYNATFKNSRPEVFCIKGFLRNLAEDCNFIKKETPVQGFSCEFCEVLFK